MATSLKKFRLLFVASIILVLLAVVGLYLVFIAPAGHQNQPESPSNTTERLSKTGYIIAASFEIQNTSVSDVITFKPEEFLDVLDNIPNDAIILQADCLSENYIDISLFQPERKMISILCGNNPKGFVIYIYNEKKGIET